MRQCCWACLAGYWGLCPTDLSKIENAIKNAKLDDTTKKKVTDIFNKGKIERHSGRNSDSVAILNKAKKLLRIT